MISDVIAKKLELLNERTRNLQIRWKPIDDYVSLYDDSEQLSEYLSMMHFDPRYELHSEDSFFVKKEESYLVLLSFSFTDEDGPKKEKIELYGIFCRYAEYISCLIQENERRWACLF